MSDGKSQTIHEPGNKFYRDADDIVLRGLATTENEAMNTYRVTLRNGEAVDYLGDRAGMGNDGCIIVTAAGQLVAAVHSSDWVRVEVVPR